MEFIETIDVPLYYLKYAVVVCISLTKGAKSAMVAYYPPYPIPNGFNHLWYDLQVPISKLFFDPVNRKWTNLQEVEFFCYFMWRGYRTTLLEHMPTTKSNQILIDKGHLYNERRTVYSKLWHPWWLPHKVSSLLWQCIEHGLPIGEWQINVNSLEPCSLCSVYVIETQSYAFVENLRVSHTWSLFGQVRVSYGLLDIYIYIPRLGWYSFWCPSWSSFFLAGWGRAMGYDVVISHLWFDPLRHTCIPTSYGTHGV